MGRRAERRLAIFLLAKPKRGVCARSVGAGYAEIVFIKNLTL